MILMTIVLKIGSTDFSENIGQMLALSYVASLFYFALFIILRRKIKKSISHPNTSTELDSINKEIDQFRSFLWSRSREYLIDTEIAAKGLHIENENEKN